VVYPTEDEGPHPNLPKGEGKRSYLLLIASKKKETAHPGEPSSRSGQGRHTFRGGGRKRSSAKEAGLRSISEEEKKKKKGSF